MTNKMMIALALAMMFCGLCLAQQPTTETTPAVAQEIAKSAAPPISCTCPVLKPAVKRGKPPVVSPAVSNTRVQTAGIAAVPPLPEWILWFMACLFGVMLFAIAFILGRVTAPQPVPAGVPVVINIPPQYPAPPPAPPAAPAAPAAPAP